MVNVQNLVEQGRDLFRALDQDPALSVDGAFWTHLGPVGPTPRLKLLIQQLPTIGPNKLYANIQKLVKRQHPTEFKFEDVVLVDESDLDVQALRSVAGRSVLLNRIMPAFPNSLGASAYVYRLGPRGVHKHHT